MHTIVFLFVKHHLTLKPPFSGYNADLRLAGNLGSHSFLRGPQFSEWTEWCSSIYFSKNIVLRPVTSVYKPLCVPHLQTHAYARHESWNSCTELAMHAALFDVLKAYQASHALHRATDSAMRAYAFSGQARPACIDHMNAVHTRNQFDL